MIFSKNVYLLFLGQFISVFSASIYSVTLVFWVKGETGSASLVGLLSMVSVIPTVVIGPIGGAIADHYSRKKIIVFGSLVNGVMLLLVSTVMFLYKQSVDLIITLLFIYSVASGVIASIFLPAIRTSVPSMVPYNRVQSANGLLQSSGLIAMMIGQLVGGVLFQMVGAPQLMLMNAMVYLIAAFSESFITIPQETVQKGSNLRETIVILKQDTIDGFRHVSKIHGLKVLFAAGAISNCFLGPFFILLPFFVEDTLAMAPKWYGFLMGGMTVGMIIGSLLVDRLNIDPNNRSKLFILTLIVQSLVMCCMAFVYNVIIALLLLICFGVSIGVFGVLIITTLQLCVPSSLRGRLYGLWSAVATSFMALSMGVVGIVADLLDQDTSVVYLMCGLCALPVPFVLVFSKGFQKLFAMDTQIAAPSTDQVT